MTSTPYEITPVLRAAQIMQDDCGLSERDAGPLAVRFAAAGILAGPHIAACSGNDGEGNPIWKRGEGVPPVAAIDGRVHILLSLLEAGLGITPKAAEILRHHIHAAAHIARQQSPQTPEDTTP